MQLPQRCLDVERGLDFLGDPALLREMLTLLSQSLGPDLVLIRQALAAGDVAAANKVLHPLKGVLPIFAADELVEQVVHAEMLSKSQTAEVVAPAFEQAAVGLERLLRQVQEYLAA